MLPEGSLPQNFGKGKIRENSSFLPIHQGIKQEIGCSQHGQKAHQLGQE